MSARADLASKIKRSLGLRGLTCSAVGRFLHINPSTVCHWCSGYAIPNLFHQEKLLSLLAEIDQTSRHLSITLLKSHDFTPFNNALLATKQAVLRRNIAQYIYSQKDKEKA